MINSCFVILIFEILKFRNIGGSKTKLFQMLTPIRKNKEINKFENKKID